MNLATVRKKEDPILKTQTDPISYKKKMEEIKDGVKGPPAPTFLIYKQERFLSEPPVAQGKQGEGEEPSGDGEPAEGQAEPTEVEQTPPGQELEQEFDESWWDEDWDEGENTPAEAGTLEKW